MVLAPFYPPEPREEGGRRGGGGQGGGAEPALAPTFGQKVHLKAAKMSPNSGGAPLAWK